MKIALAQINTDGIVEKNLEKMITYVNKAAQHGAELVVFPEAAMSAFGTDIFSAAKNHGQGWRRELAQLARTQNIAICAGEFEDSTDGRVRNLAATYHPDGSRTEYAKVHLYDAFGYKESASVHPGIGPVTSTVGSAKVGYGICYDIRFPKLFAETSRSGAQVIVVPTSWGAGPGKVEQWKILGRARALDSNCFVVAVGQANPQVTGADVDVTAPTGVGHSYVADPLGGVVVELGEGEEFQVVELDLELVAKAQETLPVLSNAQLGY